MVTTLQEKIDNWVFTLVGGDSGFDKFILELHKQPELAQIIPYHWHAEQPKSCLAADMQNICERDTTTAFQDAFVVILADVQWLL